MYSDYLNFHFSGDYVLATQTNIESSFEATDELLDYFRNLSIDNSIARETENIGKWIGYPRPYIPDNLITETAFLFYKVADLPVYSDVHGFSSLTNPLIGGRFTTLTPSITKLPLDIYKEVLKRIAFIKYNGWTFFSLDYLMSIAEIDYAFSFDAENDVVVTFAASIHPIYSYIFEIILDFFQTLPRITIAFE